MNYLLASSPAIVYSCEPSINPGINFISSNLTRILGYEPKEMKEDPYFWRRNIHPDDFEEAMARYDDFEQHENVTLQYRFRHKNGSWRWMMDEFRVVRNNEGKPVELVGSWLDITPQKDAEINSRHQSENAARYFELAGVFFLQLDVNGNVLDINKHGAQLLGLDKQAIVGKNWFQHFVPAEARDKLQASFKERISSNGKAVGYFEAPIQNSYGEVRTMIWNNTLLRDNSGHVESMLSAGEDVTENLRTHRDLKSVEELYSLVTNNIKEVVVKLQPDGTIKYVSPSCERLTGLPAEELTGKHIKAFYKGDIDTVMENLPNAFAGGTEKYVQKMSIQAGREMWVSCSGQNNYDADGNLQEMVLTLQDITLKQETEDRLHEQQQINSILLSSLPDMGVLVVNHNHEVLLAEGMPLTDDKQLDSCLTRFFKDETAINEVKSLIDTSLKGELGYRDVSTAAKTFQVQSVPLKNAEGGIMVALTTLRDITHQRRLNAKELRAMVHGQDVERKRIAEDLHDGLGQLISAIKLNLNNLDKDYHQAGLEPSSSLETAKELLNNAIKELRNISFDLMPDAISQFGFLEAVEDMCKKVNSSNMVKVSFNANGVSLKLDHETELNLYRITQELLNNSLKHSRAGHIQIVLKKEKQRLVLVVEDDGIGFSPKQEYENTLGLNTISTRAKVMNGNFDVTSKPGSGTKITVSIPLHP